MTSAEKAGILLQRRRTEEYRRVSSSFSEFGRVKAEQERVPGRTAGSRGQEMVRRVVRVRNESEAIIRLIRVAPRSSVP